jgi:hypothetical protein
MRRIVRYNFQIKWVQCQFIGYQIIFGSSFDLYMQVLLLHIIFLKIKEDFRPRVCALTHESTPLTRQIPTETCGHFRFFELGTENTEPETTTGSMSNNEYVLV